MLPQHNMDSFERRTINVDATDAVAQERNYPRRLLLRNTNYTMNHATRSQIHQTEHSDSSNPYETGIPKCDRG